MEREEIWQPRRPALPCSGARTYHVRFSRDRAGASGAVKNPRHFLPYRRSDEGAIEVARVLHDARDLERHLPEGYRRNPAQLDRDED